METRRPHRQRKKQTRLSFEPVAPSSPTVTAYDPAVQSRLANVRFEGAKSTLRRSPRNVTFQDQNLLPTPEPSSQPQIQLQEDDAPLSNVVEDLEATPTKPNKSQEGDTVTDDDDIVIPSSKRRKFNSVHALATPTRRSACTNDIVTPDSDISLQSRRQSTRIVSSPPVAKAASIGSAETSGDEATVLFTQPATRRKPSRSTHNEDPFVVYDDDDAMQVVSRARSKNAGPGANDFVVDDNEIEYISSDQEDCVPQRFNRKNKTKRRNRTRKEKDELEDDLQNLQDSDHSDVIETRRTRGGPVTTQRDRNREHFELLKRRRAGEPIPRILDSDEEDENADLDEDDGVEINNVTTAPSRKYTKHNERRVDIESDEDTTEAQEVDDENRYEDDFVVDDASQANKTVSLGIPLAFTSFASRKPRDLFIYIIEWLVKNKIAPAFSRDDELYDLSWNKINDQIKAQAGSRLISSAWNEDFKNAILARPDMQVHLVTEGSDEFFLNCDACNRTNHPARYEFKLMGQAYHTDTLEPIDEDEDDSNDETDDADETASYDQHGHLLPSTHRTYNLGRFCAANAEMGHKLTHWKYHLNQSLLEYLEEQGVLSAEAIVARDKLNKKKREKEAENIVDQMQETGMVDQLWRGLQDDLEDARFGMEDHVAKGGKRNQQRIGKVRVDRGNGRIEEWSEGGRMNLVVPDDSEGE